MHAASRAPRHVLGFYRRMAGGIVPHGVAAAVVDGCGPSVAGGAAVAGAVGPGARHRALGEPPRAGGRTVPLSHDDARTLRLIARRTWRFFTTFVTAESRALPPDNFQETPQPVVAQRTSPTNIGLYLLSAVAARDFGWVGTLDAVDRIEATLRTVKGLEHHRGHLYNWYDTRDCRPLEPRYVSSVDSGNLAGALLTLGNACREMIDQPVIGPAALAGIEDAALLLREAAHGADGGRADLSARRRLDEALDVVMTVVGAAPGTPAEWAARLSELEAAARTAAHCARDVGDAVARRSAVGGARLGGGVARGGGDARARRRHAHAVGPPAHRRGRRAAHGAVDAGAFAGGECPGAAKPRSATSPASAPDMVDGDAASAVAPGHRRAGAGLEHARRPPPSRSRSG